MAAIYLESKNIHSKWIASSVASLTPCLCCTFASISWESQLYSCMRNIRGRAKLENSLILVCIEKKNQRKILKAWNIAVGTEFESLKWSESFKVCNWYSMIWRNFVKSWVRETLKLKCEVYFLILMFTLLIVKVSKNRLSLPHNIRISPCHRPHLVDLLAVSSLSSPDPQNLSVNLNLANTSGMILYAIIYNSQ